MKGVAGWGDEVVLTVSEPAESREGQYFCVRVESGT